MEMSTTAEAMNTPKPIAALLEEGILYMEIRQ